MEYPGLENEHGFFPADFLTEGLQEEIGIAEQHWRRQGSESPIERLRLKAPQCLKALIALRRSAPDDEIDRTYAELLHLITTSLGYERVDRTHLLVKNRLVPSIAHVADADGRDRVWFLAMPKSEEKGDPLLLRFSPCQFSETDRGNAETDEPLENLLQREIFELRTPPRDVLVLNDATLLHINRDKWVNRAALRFDLAEVFGRQDSPTLNAMACFTSREALAPETGVPLADRLEDEAQSRANAVTASLKSTVRDAIEILGQEVLDVTGGTYPKEFRPIQQKELADECIRYMYRLLFLFFAEANPALGLTDFRNPIYASGYSLEVLRKFESKRLISAAERDGTYLWESLQLLLKLMNEGTSGQQHKKAFAITGAAVSLLDPRTTPILSSVQLRNKAIQQIIRLLSLKRGKSTGRISYTRLGIGQLGAVYETLISFTGTIAEQDLIEVLPKGSKASKNGTGENLLYPSWFVPRSRAEEFPQERIVYDGSQPRIYPKGSWIYRLSGRDRENTAAYYTPEPLARLLVKHTLKELEKSRESLSADDLLELKILEPAMGSGAFLAETVNQLADLYLKLKQEETGLQISQEKYLNERQKVRAIIADRNCFGVDLNPIAPELGSITLWLNSLHDGKFSPWFGDQLLTGNSLIGARRAVFSPDSLIAKGKKKWLSVAPLEIGWRKARPEGYVWQFLLPAPGMVNFDKDKSIKQFASKEQQLIKHWRKDWEKPLRAIEVRQLQSLSKVVDQLFDAVADDLRAVRESNNDTITIWPNQVMPGVEYEDFVIKHRRMMMLRGERLHDRSSPYQRLKTAMDAWCALWVWPLRDAHLLPSRQQFIHSLSILLKGGFLGSDEVEIPEPEGFLDAFDQQEAERLAECMPSAGSRLLQPTDAAGYIEETPWLTVTAKVAESEQFLHFDLVFADILRARLGFDLIVGNPPWIKPVWNEGNALAGLDPKFLGLRATDAKKEVPELLRREECRAHFLAQFCSVKGFMACTSSFSMNPFAGGGANNLYRCFIDLTFRLIAPSGNAGMVHKDGHLTDPMSGGFRRHWYSRIRRRFGFENKISSKNFVEVHPNIRFSINIYGTLQNQIGFDNVAIALLPSQIDDSYAHDGTGEVSGLRNDEGGWETRGHRDRIVKVDKEALTIINSISESQGVPVEETRLIQPFASQVLQVFHHLGRHAKFGESIQDITIETTGPDGIRQKNRVSSWQISRFWNESTAESDGLIKRETQFRPAQETIFQGPHIHVGNPLYRTARATSRTNSDYDSLDLPLLPDDYLPRTNFGPAVSFDKFKKRLTVCRWDAEMCQTDFFRLAYRRRLNLSSERTLTAAIVPPGTSHVDTIGSMAFEDPLKLLNTHCLLCSLPYDFLIKSLAKSDLTTAGIETLPWLLLNQTCQHRGLRLACLTTAYAELWNSLSPQLNPAAWSRSVPCLSLEGPVQGPDKWNRSAGLRTEFARQLALVEIDVLVAQAFELELSQLLDIYRLYFDVLHANQNGTWYDQNGRIVWTCSSSLKNVGYLERIKDGSSKSPSQRDWHRILESNPQHLECEVIDDTLPGGPRTVRRFFQGPFFKCDRVEDYKRAWAHFEQLREAHELA